MWRGETKKLDPLYEEMWEVIDIRGPNYLLKNNKTGKEKIMHHNELRRRPPRSYELWQSRKFRFISFHFAYPRYPFKHVVSDLPRGRAKNM